MFFKYLLWFRTNAHTIGGLQNFPLLSNNTNLEIYWKPFASNLENMRAKHRSEYPTVSLFDLDKDPTESNNLAELFPGDSMSKQFSDLRK